MIAKKKIFFWIFILSFFYCELKISNIALAANAVVNKKQVQNIALNKKNINKKNTNKKTTNQNTPKNLNVKKKPINIAIRKNISYDNFEKSPTVYKLNSFSALAIDASTGKVLFSENPFEKCYPASLTKLMTLYIMFEKLKNNQLKMNSLIPFSRYASSKPKSKLGVAHGDRITVNEAIDALIVLSANDVAVAFAEKIAGSEARFAQVMNQKARQLNMNSTNFGNASGLFHPQQKTTAVDMLKLALAIKKDFPEYYYRFSKTSFAFRGRVIGGHNNITKYYPGAEGLKTGFINASGFNIVSSASRNNSTVFAAVLGGDTRQQRDQYMRNLLDQSFHKIETSNLKNNFFNSRKYTYLISENSSKKNIKSFKNL